MLARLRERMTFANTMSLIAVFVALGGTSYAAVKIPRNSVSAAQIKTGGVGSSEVKNGALRKLDFRAGELPAGAKGDKGDKGDPGTNGTNGTDGAPGADGTLTTFARVDSNAGRTLEPDDAGQAPQNRGIAQADVVPGVGGAATGTTCFNLPSRPASAVVSLDNADALAADRNLVTSVAINRGESLGDCPASHNDARVRIVDGNTEAAQNARFFIWFEL